VVFGIHDLTVRLPADERTTLLKLSTTGTAAARKLLSPHLAQGRPWPGGPGIDGPRHERGCSWSFRGRPSAL